MEMVEPARPKTVVRLDGDLSARADGAGIAICRDNRIRAKMDSVRGEQFDDASFRPPSWLGGSRSGSNLRVQGDGSAVGGDATKITTSRWAKHLCT